MGEERDTHFYPVSYPPRRSPSRFASRSGPPRWTAAAASPPRPLQQSNIRTFFFFYFLKSSRVVVAVAQVSLDIYSIYTQLVFRLEFI